MRGLKRRNGGCLVCGLEGRSGDSLTGASRRQHVSILRPSLALHSRSSIASIESFSLTQDLVAEFDCLIVHCPCVCLVEKMR